MSGSKKNSCENNSLIRIENVWKKYDMEKSEPLVVLKEINLHIKENEFVAITGPSGSGKSTMVHIIGALDRPSFGKVYLKNKNIAEMSESSLAFLRGKTIGFIFQQFNLLPTLTALENVMLPMEIIDLPEKFARERAIKLLTSLGLGERLNHKPSQLSGGQQQRVAIARALANKPEVILADEPTGNLDSKTGKFVMDFLGELHEQGTTVILITHDLNLVNYAKRVVHLKDGMIEQEIHNTHRK
ncbi:MAG: ABC transporter ATP-binding protein [Flavobacterium sp.]|uniref:ABC transporter ATP-binding protein n=1 Tax=Flavobacterium sp. TaxID=239 RepID=UPI00262946C5|nr:ABC transporter ATP-binding protein [Flavobacterium sp.]MDD5149101.1 ABC transporter ATP-binding protein [Flavobacterium sp.]